MFLVIDYSLYVIGGSADFKQKVLRIYNTKAHSGEIRFKYVILNNNPFFFFLLFVIKVQRND